MSARSDLIRLLQTIDNDVTLVRPLHILSLRSYLTLQQEFIQDARIQKVVDSLLDSVNNLSVDWQTVAINAKQASKELSAKIDWSDAGYADQETSILKSQYETALKAASIALWLAGINKVVFIILYTKE